MNKKKQQVSNEPKTYPIRPDFKHKFKPGEAKEKVKEIVEKHLAGAVYVHDNLIKWNTAIGNEVRHELHKSLGIDKRYKLIIQVYSGENKKHGIRVGSRCLWDKECDDACWYSFKNDTMYCLVWVFALYLY